MFTKLHSLSSLPKACTKWKKFVAVLLKASSPFLVKFLQAWRLNLIFTRVILLSVLVIWSIPNKIFYITFQSSWIIKFFKPSIKKKSKKKVSALGSMSSEHTRQWCDPLLLEASILAIMNGYFPFFQKPLAYDL